jgi:rhodanese-related sulfurtransferase
MQNRTIAGRSAYTEPAGSFDPIQRPNKSGPITCGFPGFPHVLSKDILDYMLEPEITVEAFSQLRQQPNTPVLLDVREPWEYQTASLPSSLLMPMGEVSSRAHTELDPDAPIVVLCHHGARSLSVTMWLRNQGFEHVQSLAGGIDAWSRTIDPTVPRY